jgi:hypothetical protein
MRRIALLLALGAGLLSASSIAQTNAPAPSSTPVTPQATEPVTCLPSTTLDELVKALDDAVSGRADKDRTCLRQLLFSDARLAPVTKSREGVYGPHALTVDEWINAVRKRGSGAFYERQVKVASETYGHIAHVWSTYEIRPTPDGKAVTRGINSIQAVNDGRRWRVAEIMWQAETPAEPIPDRFLP